MIIETYEDVIVLSGALRSNFWDTIHTAISLVLKRHPTGVIIDCSGITEASPEGIETFRDIMSFIEDHDARVIVAAVPPAVLDVLKTVPEVRSQLPISESVEDARQSLDLLVETKPRPKGVEMLETSMKVLVCLVGHDMDEEALMIGSRIADTVQADIYIAFILLVPRELPIQAPLPKEEQAALAAIESGKTFLTKRHIRHKARLERGRDVASTINAMLEEIEATHVVLSLSSLPEELENSAKLVTSVLTKVPNPVVFVRGGVG
jgi:anti-anti-sigma regulatory factor